MVERMKMETKNINESNINAIKSLFPSCITEFRDDNGELSECIDFEKLKELLRGISSDSDEAFELTWVGKKASIIEANTPIRKTLRPCMDRSVDWDSTQNIYIEGDNLDALKILQESYLNRIKLIYIDPPYNTGNDFIYRDSYSTGKDEYEDSIGVFDETTGNRLFRNTDSNGRFHSDWCSMIYSRLLLARNLLSDDGVIFISIDDREQDNLRKIADEVFGSSCFIAQIVWQKRTSPDARRIISDGHEYILVYVKNEKRGHDVLKTLPFDDKDLARYKNPDNDPNGPWISTDCTAQAGHGTKEQFYDLITPAGRLVKLQDGLCWRYTKKRMDEEIAAGHIWFGADGQGVPRKKTYLADRSGKTMWTWWPNTEVGHTQEATKELSDIFGQSGIMDFPKPLRLLSRIVHIATDKDSIVLDFFSGSATTAHSVMLENAKDSGTRKFIMVQLPEVTEKNSVAYKCGFNTICELGEERIRRAGRRIKEENPIGTIELDVGFRVFKVDDSNMNDVYYSADKYTQDLLTMTESNIKSDRNDLDLLFGCLLEWGLPLSLPYTSEQIDGFDIHTYNNGDLIACFSEGISEEVIKKIAKRHPLRVVFRDSSFVDSPTKINVGEIFKMLSPDTKIKVI